MFATFFFSFQISYLMATYCTSHFHVCCLSLFFVFTCNLLPRGWVLNDFLHLLVYYWFSQLLAWWQFFSSHFHACCLLVDLVFWIFFPLQFFTWNLSVCSFPLACLLWFSIKCFLSGYFLPPASLFPPWLLDDPIYSNFMLVVYFLANFYSIFLLVIFFKPFFHLL